MDREPWNALDGLTGDEVESLGRLVALKPLTKALTQLDEISLELERLRLPLVRDERGDPVALFDCQRQELQAAMLRIEAVVDRVAEYLRVTS
jgi:hypothetical protein